jgi:hypothetical protein
LKVGHALISFLIKALIAYRANAASHPIKERGAFCDKYRVSRNITGDEELYPDCATFDVSINTVVAYQVFEALRCNEAAGLFVYFPNRALQKRLVVFAMAAK